MLINPVKKNAKKFVKSIKEDLTVSRIILYIENLGYAVEFFGTPEGDELVNQLNLKAQAERLKSFTYVGRVKYVFVKNSCHTADKRYLLLHELGHILLGHFSGDTIFLEHNMRLDNEAEAFVYFVLNHRKRNFFPFITAAAVIILFAAAVFFIKSGPSSVYITRTGESYHRSSCISLQGKRAALIERSAAQKIFDPCKICNP